jgi:hypothetical protein
MKLDRPLEILHILISLATLGGLAFNLGVMNTKIERNENDIRKYHGRKTIKQEAISRDFIKEVRISSLYLNP